MIGDTIHGHVSGYFGRDFYACARVEALAVDWVIVRGLDNDLPYAAATIDCDGLHKALIRDRDEFDPYFCSHERPTW
jgi:hypothetical protein